MHMELQPKNHINVNFSRHNTWAAYMCCRSAPSWTKPQILAASTPSDLCNAPPTLGGLRSCHLETGRPSNSTCVRASSTLTRPTWTVGVLHSSCREPRNIRWLLRQQSRQDGTQIRSCTGLVAPDSDVHGRATVTDVCAPLHELSTYTSQATSRRHWVNSW